MIKKTITGTDFNGQPYSEVAYFNVTKAEALEKQFDIDKDGKEIEFTAVLTRIGNEKRPSELVRIFRMLIEWSYGIKSDDGRRFTKSPEALADFEASNAFSDLYMELATDAVQASEFTQGILPADMQAQVAEQQATNGFRPGSDPTPSQVGQVQQNQPVQQYVAERPFEVNDAQPQPGQFTAPPAPPTQQ